MLKSYEAIKAVRELERISRAGWNGKGMYVYQWQPHLPGVLPVLVLVKPDGTHQAGWVFSQDDLFSDDWSIL